MVRRAAKKLAWSRDSVWEAEWRRLRKAEMTGDDTRAGTSHVAWFILPSGGQGADECRKTFRGSGRPLDQLAPPRSRQPSSIGVVSSIPAPVHSTATFCPRRTIVARASTSQTGRAAPQFCRSSKFARTD